MKSIKALFSVLKKFRYILFIIVFCLISFPILRANLEVEKVSFLTVREIEVTSPDDIIPVEDTLVVPAVYPKVEGMDSLSGDELKKRFVDIMLPAVLIAKHRIDSLRNKVVNLKRRKSWNTADSVFYNDLAGKYAAKDINDLLVKMVTHPNSIVLAQAAMESGWGTSRFCREANNLFGVWSFDPKEPRIKAEYMRGSKPIYLRKYKDLSHSIEDYFMVLARARAYEGFRKARLVNNDPYEMVNHLIYYSEQRWRYVRLVKLLMKKNNFTDYDRHVLDPQYYISETNFKWMKRSS